MNLSTNLARRVVMLVWRRKKRLVQYLIFGIFLHMTIFVIILCQSTAPSLEPVKKADFKR